MATSRFPRAVALLLVGLLSLCVIVVFVASASSTDPNLAPFIDNQVHSLGPNSDTWFKFGYGPTTSEPHPIVTLRLVNGTQTGVRFEVWAGENIGDWWQKDPIGKGTASSMNCDTGQLIGSGACQANDLTWAGAFGSYGTYYVHVINGRDVQTNFQLIIQGEGITLGPFRGAPALLTPFRGAPIPRGRAPSTPTRGPVALLSPAVFDDPYRALLIDNQPHTLPANAGIWYKFNYGPDNSKPVFFLRLVNGVVSGVRFEVWDGQNLKNWWLNKPIGRGTQEVLTNCVPAEPDETETPDETPEASENPSGHCPTNDLTWAGAFGGPGTFYVRVINESNFPQTYQLKLNQQ